MPLIFWVVLLAGIIAVILAGVVTFYMEEEE